MLGENLRIELNPRAYRATVDDDRKALPRVRYIAWP